MFLHGLARMHALLIDCDMRAEITSQPASHALIGVRTLIMDFLDVGLGLGAAAERGLNLNGGRLQVVSEGREGKRVLEVLWNCWCTVCMCILTTTSGSLRVLLLPSEGVRCRILDRKSISMSIPRLDL